MTTQGSQIPGLLHKLTEEVIRHATLQLIGNTTKTEDEKEIVKHSFQRMMETANMLEKHCRLPLNELRPVIIRLSNELYPQLIPLVTYINSHNTIKSPASMAIHNSAHYVSTLTSSILEDQEELQQSRLAMEKDYFQSAKHNKQLLGDITQMVDYAKSEYYGVILSEISRILGIIGEHTPTLHKLMDQCREFENDPNFVALYLKLRSLANSGITNEGKVHEVLQWIEKNPRNIEKHAVFLEAKACLLQIETTLQPQSLGAAASIDVPAPYRF